MLLVQSFLLAGGPCVPQELVIRVEHKLNYTPLNTYFYIVLYRAREMYLEIAPFTSTDV